MANFEIFAKSPPFALWPKLPATQVISEFHRLVKQILWKNQTPIALQPRRNSNLSNLISLNSEIIYISCLAFHSLFGEGEDVVSRAY